MTRRLIRPTMHQKERGKMNKQCAQAVIDHKREGLRGVVRALGAGDPSDWDQDAPSSINGAGYRDQGE